MTKAPLRRARRSPPARREAIARVASDGLTRYAPLLFLLLLLLLLLLPPPTVELQRALNFFFIWWVQNDVVLEPVPFKKENRPNRRRFGLFLPFSPIFWSFSTRDHSHLCPSLYRAGEVKKKKKKKNRRKIRVRLTSLKPSP